uniref:Nuclear autoantigenic sperm protein n=1 Tax=Aotus nancymaae TaxID=37293 RepID=A0A2K5E4Y4_AOTNA
MATESTATAAVAAELVSADKIEDVPAPSTSADKVERGLGDPPALAS